MQHVRSRRCFAASRVIDRFPPSRIRTPRRGPIPPGCGRPHPTQQASSWPVEDHSAIVQSPGCHLHHCDGVRSRRPLCLSARSGTSRNWTRRMSLGPRAAVSASGATVGAVIGRPRRASRKMARPPRLRSPILSKIGLPYEGATIAAGAGSRSMAISTRCCRRRAASPRRS